MATKKDVFFTWDGIGDNLVLLGAAYNYFRLVGKKPLIASDLPFVNYSDYSIPVKNLSLQKISTEYKKTMKNMNSLGLNPIFITAADYKYLLPDNKKCITTWSSKHMITRYCEKMGLDGEIDISIPLSIGQTATLSTINTPYICVMCGGIQKYKSVKPEVMQRVSDFLSSKVLVVQLGSKVDPPLKNVIDKKNCTLIEAYNLLKGALFFVGAVGGLIHLARAANCKSVVLQTTGEPECLTKYKGNILVKPIDICDLCAKNIIDPQHQECFFGYKCINNITSEMIIQAIEENWTYLISETKKISKYEISYADKAEGLEDYYHISNIVTL